MFKSERSQYVYFCDQEQVLLALNGLKTTPQKTAGNYIKMLFKLQKKELFIG
jgi:hypothetical protein